MAAIKLNAVPPDVIKYVLYVQNNIKKKKGIGQFSQELTVIQIIREHMNLQKEKK
jgi:hypothetical protein